MDRRNAPRLRFHQPRSPDAEIPHLQSAGVGGSPSLPPRPPGQDRIRPVPEMLRLEATLTCTKHAASAAAVAPYSPIRSTRGDITRSVTSAACASAGPAASANTAIHAALNTTSTSTTPSRKPSVRSNAIRKPYFRRPSKKILCAGKRFSGGDTAVPRRGGPPGHGRTPAHATRHASHAYASTPWRMMRTPLAHRQRPALQPDSQGATTARPQGPCMVPIESSGYEG